MASTAAKTAPAVMVDCVTTSLASVNVWQVTLDAGTKEDLKHAKTKTVIKHIVIMLASSELLHISLNLNSPQ